MSLLDYDPTSPRTPRERQERRDKIHSVVGKQMRHSYLLFSIRYKRQSEDANCCICSVTIDEGPFEIYKPDAPGKPGGSVCLSCASKWVPDMAEMLKSDNVTGAFLEAEDILGGLK